MYSDADLDAAVRAGVLSAPAAAAFREFVARSQAAPGADEEHFRLLTGFNDIFVGIAILIVLAAVGWLGGRFADPVAGAAVAAASWGLAEYFTRRRRMALPSILLLLGFVGGVAAALFTLARLVTLGNPGLGLPPLSDIGTFEAHAAAAAGTTLAAFGHWRRFHVPITVAAGAVVLAVTLWLVVAGLAEAVRPYWQFAMFLAGLGLFALAMRWDMSDRERITRRADVAFWLHLAAAPAIVHPAFGFLGLLGGSASSLAGAAMAVLLYLVLALVALVVDRRALLVSALGYVVYAITALLHSAGSISSALALAALVIGCGLLLLSALWQRARRAVVLPLPYGVRRRLPQV